jgi:hypothetical protein
MPFSNDKQITLEKSPTYFTQSISAERVLAVNPSMKLIAILCDPVVRVVSHYAHEKARPTPAYSQKNQTQSDSEQLQQLFKINKKNPIFYDGYYYDHIQKWLKYFPLNQMLFINGEQFRREPSVEMKRMESFLNLEPFIKKEHFVFNKTRGLYCMKNELTSTVKCMSGDKGRKHPSIDVSFLNKLKELYRHYNQQFFKLINDTPWWEI